MLGSLSVGEISGPAALVIIAVLVITRRLVWHTDVEKLERDRDKWQQIALQSLGVADKLTVQAEVTNEVLTHLPDPVLDDMVRRHAQMRSDAKRDQGRGGAL